MFTESAPYYDAFYGYRDYPGAVAAVTTAAKERCPTAETVLDVACGTARHLELLRADFVVEGLDISPDLLAMARDRCPDVPLHQADMTDFDLGRRFDVVMCLFSSIAYVRTAENMQRAIAAMARHLTPGGVLLVEPWYAPERYRVNDLVANVVDEPDLKISWMYVSALQDGMSLLDIHWQVGTPDGIRQFREVHELGLFTDEQYEAAFRDAGLEPSFDRDGFFSRGLVVGQRSA